MTKKEAIQAYFARFDEGPPIREMEDQAAIDAMVQAIKSGIRMRSVIDDELPPGALN